MKQKPVTLSKADYAILNSYKILAEGLAEYLGEGCEVVIHSLGNLEHSVIKIMNGQHTGRKEGSPITDLGLSMIKNLSDSESCHHMAYFNKTSDGIPLKSCSIAIMGEKGYVIGLLCINYYLNTPLSEFLLRFDANNNDTHSTTFAESFVDDVDELLKISLKEASDIVYNDRTITTSNKNKEIIAILNDKGIFNFKDSVVKIADMMGISKNTVYMHIRNITKKDND
ncbi:MAG: PAS domain-containing protein [Clostridia bacterium]|nr:PAS domain-containing protein [Clostridia bacterium]MCI2000019.1 PAS domain-containing protein [Clostridia bacterium]MCI2014447.1 PAS domain-containing protein [Clostridia bacterium]